MQLKYIACMITDNMVPEDAGERVCIHFFNKYMYLHWGKILMKLELPYVFSPLMILINQAQIVDVDKIHMVMFLCQAFKFANVL